MLNVIARHGSRHSSHVDELNELALRLNSSRAPAWLRAGWRYPLGAAAPKDLLARGDREHSQLGERLARAHPRAASAAVTDVVVRATAAPRAVRSAAAFARGALARDAIEVAPLDEWLGRFHKRCERFVLGIKRNCSARAEHAVHLVGSEGEGQHECGL